MSDSPATGPAADVDPQTVFDPARWEPDLRAMTRIVLRPIGTYRLAATRPGQGQLSP